MKKILQSIMPILKLLLFFIVIFACVFALGLPQELKLVQPEKWHPLLAENYFELINVLALFVGLLIIFRIFPKYNFRIVGFKQEKLLSGLIRGAVLGMLMIGTCAFLAMLNGNVIFSRGNISAELFFGYLIFYILVAIAEELFFRTFSFVVLAEGYHNLVAIIITSLLFGAAHLANPNFTWLAMVNIAIVGALLAVIFLLKRNIYWLIGIHFGWNFTQGTLLGYQVSGTQSSGLLLAKPHGTFYLSGGDFGIEGSIFCTIVVLIVLIFTLAKNNLKPVKEMFIKEIY